jgi:hypothetical protein
MKSATNQKNNNISVKEFNLFDDELTKRSKTEEINNINNNNINSSINTLSYSRRSMSEINQRNLLNNNFNIIPNRNIPRNTYDNFYIRNINNFNNQYLFNDINNNQARTINNSEQFNSKSSLDNIINNSNNIENMINEEKRRKKEYSDYLKSQIEEKKKRKELEKQKEKEEDLKYEREYQEYLKKLDMKESQEKNKGIENDKYFEENPIRRPNTIKEKKIDDLFKKNSGNLEQNILNSIQKNQQPLINENRNNYNGFQDSNSNNDNLNRRPTSSSIRQSGSFVVDSFNKSAKNANENKLNNNILNLNNEFNNNNMSNNINNIMNGNQNNNIEVNPLRDLSFGSRVRNAIQNNNNLNNNN